MAADSLLQSHWYRRSFTALTWGLWPLAVVFHVLVVLRRLAFRSGWLNSERVARPVIVVGNITVGGTGKTPLTLWLAQRLKERGWVPGIVLRGYRGRSGSWPRDVAPDGDPEQVGDEAVLLARQSRGIVVAGPDRVAAARRAIERGADVVLCDDGLQHYRLARDCELAVVDARRGLGNGGLLPAGPLREPAARLASVDAVVLRADEPQALVGALPDLPVNVPRIAFAVRPTTATALRSGTARTLQSFAGQSVHAIAAIGHPEGFFATLRAAGLTVIPHPLPDHAAIGMAELAFNDSLPVLMTEKDAVKCATLSDPRLWVVAAETDIEARQAATLLAIVEARIAAFRSGAATA